MSSWRLLVKVLTILTNASARTILMSVKTAHRKTSNAQKIRLGKAGKHAPTDNGAKLRVATTQTSVKQAKKSRYHADTTSKGRSNKTV